MPTLLSQPFADLTDALDCALRAGRWRGLALLAAAMVGSWWIYVPLHELFHAWGCLAAGGTVTRLEIDHAYGAAWLARAFPYVVPGSEYAGRLSGFDTHGSDAIYLATVFAPYLLTVFVGVPALRAAIRRRSAWLAGAALPWALAPLLSVGGDFYETGSIVASRMASAWQPDAATRWRSDDLPQLVSSLLSGGFGASDVAGVAAGFVLGVLGAFATYRLGAVIAALSVRRRDEGRAPN